MLDEQNDGAAEESEQVEAPQHGFASFDGPDSMPPEEPGDNFEDQEIYEERLENSAAKFTYRRYRLINFARVCRALHPV